MKILKQMPHTLQHVLQKLEDLLKMKSKDIYSILKIKQTTYSAWRTGRTLNASASLYNKFRGILGIDLYHSIEKGEVVISNVPLFLEAVSRADRVAMVSEDIDGVYIALTNSED